MFSGCNRYSKNIPLNPMPDTVNNLIKKLDISPNNSFFIRDTSVDIETVKNASIKWIEVLRGYSENSIASISSFTISKF